MDKTMAGIEKHRIINTSFGEVMLKECGYSCSDEKYCEMYTGDNFDQYFAQIDCRIDDSEENILQQIEEKLYY